MHLRKGRTKSILESSIDSALLAVEIYNKPRAPFRVENYISLMIMAWTKLFHSYFNHEIGDKFYYKKSNGRYQKVDGERKAWELKKCITTYRDLSDPVKANLDFFIKLRNKIEHRHIDREELGIVIFGECQSLLFNYENELIKIFGEDFALNESLAFSIQFSSMRTPQQQRASKKLLAKEVKELQEFIEKYRSELDDKTFGSQEFSIKLIQVPKISNTNRNDLSVEFVNWNALSDEDKENYEKVTAIIKDKVVRIEAINPGKHRPSDVLNEINEKTGSDINHHDHMCLYYTLSIRPCSQYESDLDPFETNTKYCQYDEVHGDYVYTDQWIALLITNIEMNILDKETWRNNFQNRIKTDVKNLEAANQ